ncbi:MAG: hypothetical protein Q4A05_03410 [Ruminococcus sp.]|nr:hypothetical protein [Ruminococcus sp.]
MDTKKILSAAVALTVSAGSFSAFTGTAADAEPQLLDVSGFTIHDENFVHLSKGTYLRDVSYLFDDQDKVPASADDLKVSSEVWAATSRDNWTPNQQMEYGPAAFYMDLGANYVITAIAFLDTNGTPTWTVSDGEPFDWHDIAEVNMDTYNSWRAVRFDKPEATRYLHFSSDYCDSGVSELAIYGYKASELSAEQRAKTAPVAKNGGAADNGPAAGKRVGFNAFIDDPMTAMMSAGVIREYHNFSWLIDADCQVRFTQGTWGDMDSYYSALHDRGISVIPCFQGGSTAVSGGEKANEIPVPAGADTLDPKSYAVHAQAMYQVAARYGSNKDVDLETISITDAQEVKTGLGLLTALENSNEPNKSWAGKANYFTPYELAAMCSADYDGHEGTIPNAGVHAADPDFKLAMGGLVGYSTMIQYLDEMKLWFDYNRSDGRFAVDIINVHIGPDGDDIENGSYAKTLAELSGWIAENAPGTELWVSEFEVPMSDCTVEGVDNHDNEDYQLRYAQRVARVYLRALAEPTLSYITKFQLRDEGEGVYYDSGLVTQKGKWDKKLAWYYLACMTDRLESADLVSMQDDGGRFTYTFADGGDIIKCVYTAGDAAKADISAEGRRFAYLTVPEEGLAEGRTEALAVKDGKVTVGLSGTPVYLTFTDNPQVLVNGSSSLLRPKEISLTADKSGEVCDFSAAPKDGTLAAFYRMFDEPDTMPDPVYGNTSGLKAPETSVSKSGATAYAFFDKPCIFNGFAVYDTYGTGGISVYDAHTDKLLWSSDLGSYMSRSVTLTDDSAMTDCLKIVKDGGDMNELAFYGYVSPFRDWDADRDGVVDSFDMVLIRQSVIAGGGYTVSDLVGVSRFLLGMAAR